MEASEVSNTADTRKIHAGWGLLLGAAFCGAHDKVNRPMRVTSKEHEVTCLSCLRSMVRDSERSVVSAKTIFDSEVERLVRRQRNLGYRQRKVVL